MIGTLLSNRYRIIKKLGSGGMAWVYLAEDRREDRQVAVKVLYPQHSQDLAFLQRFMQEARLAMALSQETSGQHVVPVLDYGSDRETHYLVMEYVEGEDLGHVLNEQGPLPWEEALEIARQVALALAQAHEAGVVHRDIKPGNIMIGADGRVRVLDFGIARARTSPELTQAGFVGSPHYAAPEQAMGEPVDVRADLYALGVVLYRSLTGELPFQGKTPWAIANQHIAEPPPPLAESRPDLPESVLRLVQRAMAKRPEDRFQTPSEMAEALDAVRAGGDYAIEAEAPRAPEKLYAQAQQALAAEQWHRAVNLLNQLVDQDPDYRDACDLLSEAGRHIRLAALYRAAQRALQLGHWDEALVSLDEIEEVAPGYRDVADLRASAERGQQRLAEEEASAPEHPTQIETPALDAVVAPEPEGAESAPDPAPASPPPSDGGRRRVNWLWFLIPLLLLGVVAGGYALVSGGVLSLAAATPIPTPTATAIPPSPTATATQTPRPSATATATAKPSATATASRTPVAVASDTPTSTPSPTATPTASPLPGQPTAPALTGQIAFPRFDVERQTYDVYICAVDGTGCRRAATQASQPDFLPGGDQIVVHSWKPDEKGLVLHVLDEDRIWRITGQIEAARPSVGFQGSAYVYHSRQETDRQPRLFRTFGTETRPIQREGSVVVGVAPAWTPDGRILYSGCWRDSCGILLMRADGSNPRQVVAGSSETNPEASPAPLEGGPGGGQVAFMSQRDGNWEVYVVNLDGSGLRRLTRDPANDGLPTWSPSGEYLAFVSNRTGRWAVWAMRPDGSEQRRLFDVGGPLEGPVRGAAPHEVHGWVEERISWASMP